MNHQVESVDRGAVGAVQTVDEAVVDLFSFGRDLHHVPGQLRCQRGGRVASADDEDVASHVSAGPVPPIRALASTAPQAATPPTATAPSTHSHATSDGLSSWKNSRTKGRAIVAP